MHPRTNLLRNLVLLNQVGNGTNKRVARLIDSLFDDFASEIARHDPTGVLPRFRELRLKKLSRAVRKLTGAAMADVRKLVADDMAHLGVAQSRWSNRLLSDMITQAGGVGVSLSGGIGLATARAIVTHNPMHGRTLARWSQIQGRATTARVLQQVRLGMTAEESMQDIVRRVRGRRAGGRLVGGVLQKTRRETTAVVRTAVNSISNAAQWETYRANKGVLNGYIYTATLDTRTSDICIALDGTFHSLEDKGAPRPPQHINCRSSIVPDVDWKSLGLKPPPSGQRASMDGPVASSTNYTTWLRGQPINVQDQVLGRGRGVLFRSKAFRGNTLGALVRQDGSSLTVAEFAERIGR